MRITIAIVISLLLISCESSLKDYNLPSDCAGTCQIASDINSLRDAVANSHDAGRKCVCIEDSTIKGSVTIGKSLILAGKGRDKSFIEPVTGDALVITGGSVTIQGLSITSDEIALKISNTSDITVSDCSLKAKAPATEGRHSFAIFTDTVTELKIKNTELTGNNQANTVGGELRATKAALTNVDMNNFTAQGLLIDSGGAVTWDTGIIKDISTVTGAVYLEDSSLDMKNIKITGISIPQISSALTGGLGIIAKGESAALSAQNTEVTGCISSGIIFDSGAKGTITASKVSGNGLAGVWIQNSPENAAASVAITGTTVDSNAAAGVYAYNSCGITVDNSVISGTKSRQWKTNIVGDGIVLYSHGLSDAACGILIENTVFQDNFRAGIIADGTTGAAETAFSGVSLKNIYIKGIGAEQKYGAVAQNGTFDQQSLESILENPFKDNDLSLSEPLYIISENQNF